MLTSEQPSENGYGFFFFLVTENAVIVGNVTIVMDAHHLLNSLNQFFYVSVAGCSPFRAVNYLVFPQKTIYCLLLSFSMNNCLASVRVGALFMAFPV